MPGLFNITDLASARRAVEEIVLQGEGAPAHRAGSHYERFAAMREELAALTEARPGFAPARPAIANPSLGGEAPGATTPIRDPASAKVADLGNAIYALMMRTFAQVFSPAPLPHQLRLELAAAATELMYGMTFVGEAVTRLPAGGDDPAARAGLSFALPMSPGQLVQRCAAQILGERARELAGAAARLEASAPLAGLAGRLNALADRFGVLHERFETHLTVSVDAVANVQPSAAPRPAPPPSGPAADADPNVARTPEITLRFDARRCIHSRRCVLGAPSVFLANVQGPWLHPETVPLDRCVAIAHNCPSGAITYERHDGGPQEGAPDVNVLTIREDGPYAIQAQIELEDRGAMFRATLCRCGKSANKPFCDNSHRAAGFAATGEPATQATDPLEVRNGRLVVTPLTDGPLQVSAPLEICSGTGRTVSRVETARLCRCGGSASKPFCDGTHARIGFRSDPPAAEEAASARPVA